MQQPSETSVAMADEPGEVIEEESPIEVESLIEEISIDGMCGVY